ncbi:hypothetical protein BDA96_10G236600 [Sorghum bicolor]|uniref:Uncharacterized protein n=2 Tax=Sorghum bicolor TaxID=4558 RepID=A0A921Q699_SORBI|nr:hypothetical protein BDA96_10G236600 [Sorghum bicolor]KXG20279.1 hypothetical protein SORBI_3010G180000 [Sorghum bicolor]
MGCSSLIPFPSQAVWCPKIRPASLSDIAVKQIPSAAVGVCGSPLLSRN